MKSQYLTADVVIKSLLFFVDLSFYNFANLIFHTANYCRKNGKEK